MDRPLFSLRMAIRNALADVAQSPFGAYLPLIADALAPDNTDEQRLLAERLRTDPYVQRIGNVLATRFFQSMIAQGIDFTHRPKEIPPEQEGWFKNTGHLDADNMQPGDPSTYIITSQHNAWHLSHPLEACERPELHQGQETPGDPDRELAKELAGVALREGDTFTVGEYDPSLPVLATVEEQCPVTAGGLGVRCSLTAGHDFDHLFDGKPWRPEPEANPGWPPQDGGY